MIEREIWVLAGTAASLGLIHTVIGPDHYLPFIVMSRARSWTLRKTLFISFLAGLGHILSSVVLGFVGIALGIAVAKLEGVESARGEIAAWLLIGFGLAYFIWGMRRAWKGKPHAHAHLHGHGGPHEHPHGPEHGVHEHVHSHEIAEHAHPHGEEKKANITPWVLFTIFVFGPCEPLIPLIMYPAARHSTAGVA
ncbi:MAG: hypothetical protein NT147_04595, partial [Candidatus Aminicenantes bacterium]|nr:hypothetical protein [Candidatus Aminicenantes bacterium]